MNALFVIAHPDDEALGAGATIKKIVDGGGVVSVLTLSTVSATRTQDTLESQQKSHAILGVCNSHNLDLVCMKFGEADRYETVQAIEAIIRQEKPDTIFTHSPFDLHNDHKLANGFAQEAARLFQRQTGYNHALKKLLYIEVPTSTDWQFECQFTPNSFSAITPRELEAKVTSIACYHNVLRDLPHPRNKESINALARYRGGQCGTMYAEAFRIAMEVF